MQCQKKRWKRCLHVISIEDISDKLVSFDDDDGDDDLDDLIGGLED